MKTPRLDSCNFLEYPIMVLKQRTLFILPVFWLVFLDDPLFPLIFILNKNEYEINSPKVDEKYIILSFFYLLMTYFHEFRIYKKKFH